MRRKSKAYFCNDVLGRRLRLKPYRDLTTNEGTPTFAKLRWEIRANARTKKNSVKPQTHLTNSFQKKYSWHVSHPN
jgi:hypothetical protein